MSKSLRSHMMGYSVALVIAITLGVLAVYFPIYVGAVALVLSVGLVWVWWSRRHLLAAFAITLFTVILISPRLELQILHLQGTGRGFISLSDPLWLGLIISFLLKGKKLSFPRSALGILPYIALTIILPIIGVSGGFPFSYITPAMRALQWASFGWMAFLLAKEFGVQQIFRRISWIILLASAIHFTYAIVQYATYTGFISSSFLRLDRLYAASHELSWFYYPRMTGLFVNPNSYGLFCALAALLAIPFLITQQRWTNKVFLYALVLMNLAGILLSGSRSALIGFVVASSVMILVALARVPKLPRIVEIGGILCCAGVFAVLAFSIVPSGGIIFSRFQEFLGIAREGVSVSPSGLARVEMWKEAWHIYATSYPLGTGVPPSYALGMAVDSYYVYTLTQGTLIFTMFFLFMLTTVASAGYACWRMLSTEKQALGFTVLGFTMTMAIGSLFLSPPLESYLVIPFWAMAGLAFTGSRHKRSMGEPMLNIC